MEIGKAAGDADIEDKDEDTEARKDEAEGDLITRVEVSVDIQMQNGYVGKMVDRLRYTIATISQVTSG